MNSDTFSEHSSRPIEEQQKIVYEVVDAKEFKDGNELCSRIDACLDRMVRDGKGKRQPVVLFYDYETRELLRTRFDCDIYEHVHKTNRARIRGRRLDAETNARNE